MKLALAQTRPAKGDIEANVLRHGAFVKASAGGGANLILFSELSLTGYEPQLAKSVATTPDNERLLPLVNLSQEHNIVICAGLPMLCDEGTYISMVAFYPDGRKGVFSKYYLHEDEVPFFVSGNTTNNILDEQNRVGLAICYELSVEEHLQQLLEQQPAVYMASVAKSAKGMEAAGQRLSTIARTHSLPALIVNCVGEYDHTLCTGSSAIWDATGIKMASLGETEEGLLIWDSAGGAIQHHAFG